MTATATPRVHMRDRVKIGQPWQRNRGKEIAVIRQIHRADRQVELRGIEGIRLVSFTELRRYWTQLSTVGLNQPTRPGMGTPPAMPAAPSTSATVQAPISGTAGTTSRGRFRPPAAHITVACRCTLTGTTPCPACNGTRQVARPDLWDRSPGRSDLENSTNPEGDAVPLPQTKSSREGRDPRDARVLIAGPPKVGKTTLAAGWAPDTTLILDTHQGTRLLDGEHYVQPITNFGEFESAVDEIVAGQHKFRTVVIDLIEDIWKQTDRLAAQRHNQLAAGLVEFGKGTAEAEALFRRAIDKLLATSYGIWFVGHTETVQDGNQTQFVPRLDKRIRTYIEGVCEFVLLADARGPVRQIHTAPSARFQSGSRVALPDPMDLDARQLYVEIAKGLSKPKAAPAVAPATTIQDQPKEPIAA